MARPTGELILDDVFRALAHRDRRRLLVGLMGTEQNEEILVPEGFPEADLDAEISRVALEHNHLPLLDALDVVSWNRIDSTISLGPNFDDIRVLLELLDELQDELPGPWL